jgi:starch-binding outer membrane protein, SusD/RagB family
MTLKLKNYFALAALIAGVGAAAACSDYLQVVNPSAVDVTKLTDSTNAGLLVNGAMAEFQSMWTNTIQYSSLFSDESQNAHVNISFILVDARSFTDQLDINRLVYSPIQRARYDGDTVAARLIGYEGATAAASDVRVARMLALEGYSLIMLGETYCSSPIYGGAPLTSDQLLALVKPKFDSAIAIGRAAIAANRSALNVASADSVVNLSLVGEARAALDLKDYATATTYASQVPSTFTGYRSYYSEGIPTTPGLPTNVLWGDVGSPQASTLANGTSVSGGFSYVASGAWLVVAPPFENLNDPRMPTTLTRVRAMNANNYFIANKTVGMGGTPPYTKPTTALPGGQAITPGTSMRVASYIEAQYIIAEANQGNASTLAFVNQQRTANGLTASTAVTPAEILADLRDQRRREFYLDGHRLGDMRRYITQYGLDFFPSGTYPNTAVPNGYGTLTCFPLPSTESNSNPNVPHG